MNKFSFFGFLLVLISVFEEGLSAKCWQCHSKEDPICNDPFEAKDTSLLFNCDVSGKFDQIKSSIGSILGDALKPEITCTKGVFKGPAGEDIVIRACNLQVGDSGQTCPHHVVLASQNAELKYCESCIGDGCNSSSTAYLSFSVLLTALYFIFACQ